MKRRIAVGLLSVAMSAAVFAQSIVTIAGGGTADGRPATVVGLSDPGGIAVDAEGNLYIADTFSNRVRKVRSSSGIITTVAGNDTAGFGGDHGAATLAELNYIHGLALDSAGNLFIADTNNLRIRKVAAGTGIITTVAGNGSATFSGDGGAATDAGLNQPAAVAVDREGNLYIADLSFRIRRVSAETGIIVTVCGNGSEEFSGDGGPATAAGLANPRGLAVDSGGDLYIADGPRVRRVSVQSGTITTVAGNGSSEFGGDGGAATEAGLEASGVAVDAAGNLFIADAYNHCVRKVEADTGIIFTVAGTTQQGFFGDGGPATAAGLGIPINVALDGAGNLYINDTGFFGTYNDRIRKVAAGTGIITTVAGNGVSGYTGDGGLATAAGLSAPGGVAIDSSGTIYIADTDNHRVRRIANRIISTFAGTGTGASSDDGKPATVTPLGYPYSVALDKAGNLYIADDPIRKVDASTGIVSTVAGNRKGGYSGDGGPATDAGIGMPFAIALDSAGSLYIADSGNNRIRKVAAETGIITTVAGNGSSESSGDGGPATAAGLYGPRGLAFDAAENLYIAEFYGNRIRKVDAATGIIATIAGERGEIAYPQGLAVDSANNIYIADTLNFRVRKISADSGLISTVAGNGSPVFGGDGGAATSAGLNPASVAVDSAGTLYISGDNRIRAVFACVAVTPPPLREPSNASTGVQASPRLTWASVNGALTYDVYLDAVDPPNSKVATDLTAPSWNPSNLEPLTTYYWKVIAKGDPFCTPVSSAASIVQSFATLGTCARPGPFSGN